MDFGISYTQEQESFRKEVRAWLEANVPQDKRLPLDQERDYTPELHGFQKQLKRKLGEKGWLFPAFPKKYGGGGLSADQSAILEEEFEGHGVEGAGFSFLTAGVLLVWATEEQKEKFLVPLLKGEKTEHMRMTEPHSGADLADYRSHAERDGDEWVINGENVFISAYGDEDYFPGPLLTDPEAPRHRNMGYFMVPNYSKGLLVNSMDLLVGHRQKQIYMTDVRVPADHLIGGDHQGWQVHSTHLEIEHGGGGRAVPVDKIATHLVKYAQTATRNGASVGADPVVQQRVVEAHLEARVGALLAKRTYWLYSNRMPVQYEGNVADVFRRLYTLRNATRARDVLKMDALVSGPDPRSLYGGLFEINQRGAAGQNHAGGSTNIAKVILARRIGISRTKERAAPTPSSTGQIGS